jgi:hypothetical protein
VRFVANGYGAIVVRHGCLDPSSVRGSRHEVMVELCRREGIPLKHGHATDPGSKYRIVPVSIAQEAEGKP